MAEVLAEEDLAAVADDVRCQLGPVVEDDEPVRKAFLVDDGLDEFHELRAGHAPGTEDRVRRPVMKKA